MTKGLLLPFVYVGLSTSFDFRRFSKEDRIRLVKGGRDGGREVGGAMMPQRDGRSSMLRKQTDREKESKGMIEFFLPSDNRLTVCWDWVARQLGIFGLLRMLSCKVHA